MFSETQIAKPQRSWSRLYLQHWLSILSINHSGGSPLLTNALAPAARAARRNSGLLLRTIMDSPGCAVRQQFPFWRKTPLNPPQRGR